MEQENRAIVTRFYEEGVNQRNWQVVADLIAPEFVHGGEQRGPEGQRRSLEALYAAFPDARVTLDDVIVVGDLVVSRMTWRGAQRGAFMGVPASGNPVAWSAIAIIRVVGVQIVQAWVNEDDLGLLQQLGATVQAPKR